MPATLTMLAALQWKASNLAAAPQPPDSWRLRSDMSTTHRSRTDTEITHRVRSNMNTTHRVTVRNV